MFTVRCPRCQHDMLYAPQKAIGKKRCVYCGMTFAAHANLPDSRIVCEGKRAAFNAPLM